MKHLAYCCLFLAATTLHSQSWFDNNPSWVNYFTFGWAGDGYEYISVSGDTVLGGQPAVVLERYHAMNWSNSFSDYRIVRQTGDTIWTWGNGDAFHVLYNFSLGVGDTVSVPYFYGNGALRYVVDSTGQIDIDQQTLRFQRVQIIQSVAYITCRAFIFERIGMINAQCFNANTGYKSEFWLHFFLDNPNTSATDGPGWYFCQYRDDQIGYTFPGSHCDGITGTADNALAPTNLRVAPNPFNDYFTITLPAGEQIDRLRVFHISGTAAPTDWTPGQNRINTAGWPAGAYFLEIVTEKGKRYWARAIRR